MGQDFSEIDEISLRALTKSVSKLFDFRKNIQGYLKDRMLAVAPNLTTLVGESVGAKLI